MKKLVLTIMALNCVFGPALSQGLEYLNSKLEHTDSIQASFVRETIDQGNNEFSVSIYFLTGEKYREGTVNLIDGKYKEHGISISYYKNGEKAEECEIVNGKEKGTARYWYTNGRMKAEFFYYDSLNLDQEFLIINFYDSLGNQLVDNGSGTYFEYQDGILLDSGRVSNQLKQGVWKGSFNSGTSTFRETFADEILENGESIDSLGNIFQYSEINTQASYKGDNEEFYKKISGIMTYPPKARRRGIQGRVFVEFLVNKIGEIKNVHTVRGIDPECDREAERAIRLTGSFNPGLHRGQPGFTRMILPIVFKLGSASTSVPGKTIMN